MSGEYIEKDALLEIFKALKWDASCSIVDDMPTADVYEIVREYCEKRCLAVVDNFFLIHLVNKMGDEMKKKPIDPVAIKQAIKDGQLVCFEKSERIYIQDGITGDCVCVLNLAERKECNE